jgi:hypothetical protein
MRKFIGFRLRNGRDDDIIAALSDTNGISDLTRKALRKELGLTEKDIECMAPLVTGSRDGGYTVIPITTKPVIFIPKKSL